MKNKTDIEKIKFTTKAIARAVPIKQEGVLPIAIHPFTKDIIWYQKALEEKENDLSKEKYNLTNEKVYEEWCKDFDKVIDNCKTIEQIYIQWRTAWKLTFMKFCGEYMSEKEYAQYLAHSWVEEENPNMDSNVSIKEAIKMFKSCKKQDLMEENDYEYWKKLPEKVELYRGVSKGRIKLGLSWTDDKEMAKWFMNRWKDSKNCLLKVKVDKKDIIAYFNTRGEKECLLNVLKYKNKIKEVRKI